ncbi:Cysteine proteinase inhibitor 3 [Sesamum angolense]|uniref:Cysteine proteinase inhibitor n=1 Tax=Sesamum angolense TaxID=2727404 RepID=A0AAE2C461_9LAMI|nr:Cysteine proteinase inhibitor 3 [Sesamum angolense]
MENGDISLMDGRMAVGGVSKCSSLDGLSYGGRLASRSGDMVGGIHPVKGAQNSTEINDLARFAVDEQKKKENRDLEFKKVLSAKEQVVAGTMYYITLEAADGGKKKVYEAKVWVKPWMNFKEVEEFKLEVDA